MSGSAALCAAHLKVRVADGAVEFQLVGADGTIHDRVAIGPRERAWDLALFGPSNIGMRLVARRVRGAPVVAVESVTAWTLDPRMISAAAVIPHPPLAPEAGWSRVYGHPGAEDTAGRLRERVFATLTEPTPVPWIGALETLLEPGDELSRAVMISGLYEPETMCAIRDLLPARGVFVDVGAHCGMFTLFAAQQVGPDGTVIGFEPSAREFTRLEAQVTLNRLNNVHIHRCAIADAAGVVQLRLAEAGHAGHNTIGERFAYGHVKMARLETVPATTLDIALADLTRCDVMKMDIEGAELRALAGGAATIARLRPALVLEVFDAALAGSGHTLADFFGWLDAHGYDVHDIDPDTAGLMPRAAVAPGVSKNIVALPRT